MTPFHKGSSVTLLVHGIYKHRKIEEVLLFRQTNISCLWRPMSYITFKTAFRSHKVTSVLTPTVQLEDVLCCGLHLLCMENENPWEMFTVGKRYNMWSQVSILTICISEMSRIHRKDT